MSRHRVKNIGYDDDSYDDDYEDDSNELSPEDREQMKIRTIEVKQLLQSQIPPILASDNDIWEALWHYYYDVDKSVGYLEKKYRPAQKDDSTNTKVTKKQDQIPPSPFPRCVETLPVFPCPSPISAREFFRDSPWLNVPPERRAVILIEPLYPKLGLLGGASSDGPGKMSKLAALAAARRKKESEKRQSESTTGSESSSGNIPVDGQEPSKPMSIRERLAKVGGSKPPSSEPRAGYLALRRKDRVQTASPEPNSIASPDQQQRTGLSKLREPSKRSLEELAPVYPEAKHLKAEPSLFASIIVGKKRVPNAATVTGQQEALYNLLDFVVPDITEVYNFTGPSPDDIVLKAQSAARGNKAKKAAAQQAASKAQGDVTNNLQQLPVQETRVKSKNLDVLEEHRKKNAKKSANFVVIGHVDAGKSTLMGRLLYDLKAVDQRTLEKFRREADRIGKGSFAFAWVMDQGAEERARGVTIDIATNQFETEHTSFTILDAPGHRDFVPNMIAGASQADFAVLVIDASTGSFESGLKGQTKEHALLVRSMGVQKLVVAVNKMDSVAWSKDRFDEIEQQIASFLTAAGFQAKNLSFVPCAGLHGENITRKCEDKNAAWYKGKILIDELETSERFTYALDKPLRMTIADIFRGGIQNPLSISGRIDAGSLQVGDQVLVMPSGEKATIKGVDVGEEPVDWAVAGQNAVLHLTNIDPQHLRMGDIISSQVSPVKTITSFTTKVLAFEHLTPMHIDVHRGRLHVPGRITKLVATLDKASGAPVKKKPKIIAPGTVARVVVEMDQPIPLEPPARVVLRSSGETVAAGLVE
ncbi:Hsp70 suppressor, GTPase facilitates ribosomal subunit dissociation [Myotisia sp. PD_48]|nr:Hsp70 suppressor, GTPase facilitates ribosomal subunit dissociation [Myotisia sp. PD_48]